MPNTISPSPHGKATSRGQPAETMALGFCFVPSPAACNDIARLFDAIDKRHPSAFSLQASGRNLPHMSIFQGQFARDALPSIETAVRATQAQCNRGPVRASLRPPELWLDKVIFVDVDADDDLRAWQTELIRQVEPLRQQDMGSADPQVLVGLKPSEQDSFDRYRYPFVGEALRPHLTMGRVEHNKSEWPDSLAILRHDPLLQRNIEFTSFAIFEVGMFGSLLRIVADFPLEAR